MEIGEKFVRLTVQEIIGKSAVCVCECGGKKLAYCSYLERGLIKSCGCLEKETRIKKAKKWGDAEDFFCIAPTFLQAQSKVIF